MSNDPIVTVVIPTRNRCDWLKETVASVCSQTLKEWELIIVDDASTDDTWPWVNSLADSRIRPVRLNEHSERTRARNAGLAAARGPFILFLDDDDLLPERALEAHHAALATYSDAVASFGGYTLFGEPGWSKTVRIVRRQELRYVWNDVLFGWTPVSGHTMLRTESVRSADGWDGRYIPIEDHVMWLRILRSRPVAVLPDSVLFYRVHGGQWRPPNYYEMMNDVREKAVARIEGKERQSAERILRARYLFQAASAHYARAEMVKAFSLYLQAFAAAPNLIRSPLSRSMLLQPAATRARKASRIVLRRLFSFRKSAA